MTCAERVMMTVYGCYFLSNATPAVGSPGQGTFRKPRRRGDATLLLP